MRLRVARFCGVVAKCGHDARQSAVLDVCAAIGGGLRDASSTPPHVALFSALQRLLLRDGSLLFPSESYSKYLISCGLFFHSSNRDVR